MTLIRNPIKTTGGLGGAIAAVAAAVTLTATPSFADRDTQPIDLPKPIFPVNLAQQGIAARCYNYFDVSPEGYVINLEVKCGHPGFVDSSRNAVATLRFEPKLVNGEAVIRKGVVYPIEYGLYDEHLNPIAEILEPED